MKKLYVYADFDWFKEVELIGELGYESLRGEVIEAIKGWRELATRLGIPKREMDMFL